MRYRRRHMSRRDEEPADFAPLSQEEQELLLRVVEVLRKMKYGTVLLVVQDGKVVQIEMAEKIRLR
jgi:hypothetical protein